MTADGFRYASFATDTTSAGFSARMQGTDAAGDTASVTTINAYAMS